MLIQSDSRLYIRRGQRSGSPGEEGTGESRKPESRGPEDGYIWGLEAGAERKKTIVSIVCWDPLNKKMNRKMNKNVKFWHSLKVKPGFLILLINLKGHKSTGGGRTWYGKRETLVPPRPPYDPPPFVELTKKKLSSFYSQRITCITQESEARNRSTSIRSRMILEFWNTWSLNLSFLRATDPNFLWSGNFGHP